LSLPFWGRFTRILFALGLCLGLAAGVPAQVTPTESVTTPTLQPIPWQQRMLFIPYQLNQHVPATRDVAQVQLLVSRTGANDWIVLQSAQPNVQGFSYHAPEDGEYWFALKHLDATGQTLDGPAIHPQLHLVIDTQVGPEFKAPSNVPASDPFQTATKPVQDWPANNQLPTANPQMTPITGPPPILNPYTATGENPTRRTPARFAVDGSKGTAESDANGFASNLPNGATETSQAFAPQSQTKDADWSSTGCQEGPLLVNARTFDVEYDLQTIGPWGVAKVELWGTQDEGDMWQSFGVDPDNRSPIRVTVPHGGTFGFRILVEGANAASATPPQSGDKPELVVIVDLQPPQAELLAVEPAEGNLSDQLRIRWTANDTNLEPRPIGLFYSSHPNGPWSTIAAGLENTGFYTWRIERHIPGRFFLRLEARDTAGNVAIYQSPEPIELNRPQPTGTLRSVRPVTDVPVVGK
jgi:hypothetical protein